MLVLIVPPQLSSRSATSTNFSSPVWLIQGVCRDQTVTFKWLSQSHIHVKELNGRNCPSFFKLPLLKPALMSGGEMCVCLCQFIYACVCVCMCLHTGQAGAAVVAGSELQRHRPVRPAGQTQTQKGWWTSDCAAAPPFWPLVRPGASGFGCFGTGSLS